MELKQYYQPKLLVYKMEQLTHVDSELPQIRIELTGETQASGNTRHDNRHEVVEVAVVGS